METRKDKKSGKSTTKKLKSFLTGKKEKEMIQNENETIIELKPLTNENELKKRIELINKAVKNKNAEQFNILINSIADFDEIVIKDHDGSAGLIENYKNGLPIESNHVAFKWIEFMISNEDVLSNLLKNGPDDGIFYICDYVARKMNYKVDDFFITMSNVLNDPIKSKQLPVGQMIEAALTIFSRKNADGVKVLLNVVIKNEKLLGQITIDDLKHIYNNTRISDGMFKKLTSAVAGVATKKTLLLSATNPFLPTDVRHLINFSMLTVKDHPKVEQEDKTHNPKQQKK